MHIDILTFRASLYNVGLGKKARYFLIQTLIADCEILKVPSKGGWGDHWGSKHIWYGEDKGRKGGKTSNRGRCINPEVKTDIFYTLEKCVQLQEFNFLLFSPLNSQESFGSQGVKRVTLWDQLAAHQLWRLRVGDAGKLDWTAGCYEQGVV